MKLSRLVGLLAPVGALVACSAAPVDAPEATAKSKEELSFCPAVASCQTVGFTETLAGQTPDLLALGCESWSTVLAYQTENFAPIGGESGLGPPLNGYFVACPPAAASQLTPSCSYCLSALDNGWFWYEWMTFEYRPCPSGCLRGPPLGEL